MFFDNENFAACVTDVLRLKTIRNLTVPTNSRSFCALSYRHSAQTYLETENGIIEAGKNSIVLVPSGVQYLRRAENEDMTVIHFMPTCCPGNEIKVFYPENFTEYEKYFIRMLRLWSIKDNAYNLKCNEYFMRIAHMISLEYNEYDDTDIASRAAGIIEKNFFYPAFSVESIAEMLDVSSVYVRKKFKEKYGVSPRAYICEKRMCKAEMLLETNYFTVKEVAARCGFENEKYFSTAFKKNYGVSPSEFKTR